jgi:GDP-L-fucose synthase
VLPGLIRKMHDAKRSGQAQVLLWGTGTPRREFLFVQDLVEALVFLMLNYDDEDIINVGSGVDISIADLAALIAEKVGFRGEVTYDTSKPDGTPVKLTDIGKILALGWKPKTDLAQGIQNTYRLFLANYPE